MSLIINPYRFGGEAPPASFPEFVVASTSFSTSGSTLSIGWPVGYVAGDLGMLVLQSPNQPPDAVSGWNRILSAGTGTAGTANSTAVTIYTRIAASGSESFASIPVPGSRCSGVMLVFRGVDSVSPTEAIEAGGSGTTGAISIPATTTLGANRLVLMIVADGRDANGARYSGWTNSDLASVTEILDNGTASGVGGGVGVAAGQRASAGSVGAGSVTFDLSSTSYVSAALAIKPA